jgi:hypothetical protein
MSQIARVQVEPCDLFATHDIPGFNLGPAALEGRDLDVSAIGFVGRLDVEDWEYAWTHGNLYSRHKLNGFGKPEIFAERVVWPEVTAFSHKPRNVAVDKQTGAISIATPR